MNHRISVGALVLNRGQLLLARHRVAGKYDFWAPPGGGVAGEEELTDAVEREAFEETSIRVKADRLAYIEELIDDSGRMVKFWYFCEYLSGQINDLDNPATEEAIAEADWFSRERLPSGHVFQQSCETNTGRMWRRVSLLQRNCRFRNQSSETSVELCETTGDEVPGGRMMIGRPLSAQTAPDRREGKPLQPPDPSQRAPERPSARSPPAIRR